MIGRRGFTLIELLVVVAILAVLIALLLPVLKKAKRAAERVACASHMRQVGIGLLLYAQDHRGWFPAPADLTAPQDEDWIHWHSGRDLTQSRVYKYVGRKLDVLRCPSGILRPVDRYQFSYAINVMFTGASAWPYGTVRPWSGRCNLYKAINPSGKLLLAEVNSETIFDGGFWPGNMTRGSPDGRSVDHTLSIRHDRSQEYSWSVYPGRLSWGRGNVIYADGHYGFIERWEIGTLNGDPLYKGKS